MRRHPHADIARRDQQVVALRAEVADRADRASVGIADAELLGDRRRHGERSGGCRAGIARAARRARRWRQSAAPARCGRSGFRSPGRPPAPCWSARSISARLVSWTFCWAAQASTRPSGSRAAVSSSSRTAPVGQRSNREGRRSIRRLRSSVARLSRACATGRGNPWERLRAACRHRRCAAPGRRVPDAVLARLLVASLSRMARGCHWLCCVPLNLSSPSSASICATSFHDSLTRRIADSGSDEPTGEPARTYRPPARPVNRESTGLRIGEGNQIANPLFHLSQTRGEGCCAAVTARSNGRQGCTVSASRPKRARNDRMNLRGVTFLCRLARNSHRIFLSFAATPAP